MSDALSHISHRAPHRPPVPFVRPDLPPLRVLAADMEEIFASGMLTKGPHLERFEAALADHLQVRHAVCVSSCTSGLMLTYRGLGLEGEVVVPSFTFMATVTALAWAGLRPVFADVDAGTTNVDPQSVQACITPRTSAIVAVHNFGNPARIAELEAIASRHGLKLVFDAAHGFGARYRGEPVGAQADAHVFSMSPTKLLVAGEGGAVATNNDELAAAVRQGREYGNDGTYDCTFAGLNARMPELSALVGLHSLGRLEETVHRRGRQADRYREHLADVPGIGFIQVRPEDRCAYKDFSIVIDPDLFGATRDQLADALAGEGIATRKYYDPPVHRQTAFRAYNGGAMLSNTDLLAAGSLSLPVGPHVHDACVGRICEVIRRVHQETSHHDLAQTSH